MALNAAAWALCLAWAAEAGGLATDPEVAVQPGEQAWPAQQLELRWLHSIERGQWIERYVLPAAADAAAQLRLQQVRVVGSGAGMEPAPQARWRAGGYEWSPATPVPTLLLAHSPHAADYTLCLDGRCAPLTHWLPNPAAARQGVIRLRPCRLPTR
ncbi:MAG: DUF1850 domain-containing protein [Tepidimonas sp.]|nr:DUF1850 domain-containing protein [Tepidimonas sp.]MCX7741805.1 DUF1850 domain-containing protein [Tepidimonas sp.]